MAVSRSVRAETSFPVSLKKEPHLWSSRDFVIVLLKDDVYNGYSSCPCCCAAEHVYLYTLLVKCYELF